MPEGQPVSKEHIKEQIPYGLMSDEMWRMLLERDKAPSRIAHELAGDRFSLEEKKWVHISKSMLNESGINWVVGQISHYFDVSFVATDLTEEEVKRFTKEMVLPIIGKFAQCHKEFDIERSNLIPLIRKIEQMIYVSLSASRKGLIVRMLVPQYHREETYKPMEPEKGGFWSNFSLFGGGKKDGG